MTVKQRSPAMRHVTRTHRVDLDFLFTVINSHPGIFMSFISNKQQIADILTKGQFTSVQWNALCALCQLDSLHGEAAAPRSSSMKKCSSTRKEEPSSSSFLRLKPERQAESLVRVAQEGFNLRDQLYTHQPHLSSLSFFCAAGVCWSLLQRSWQMLFFLDCQLLTFARA